MLLNTDEQLRILRNHSKGVQIRTIEKGTGRFQSGLDSGTVESRL